MGQSARDYRVSPVPGDITLYLRLQVLHCGFPFNEAISLAYQSHCQIPRSFPRQSLGDCINALQLCLSPPRLHSLTITTRTTNVPHEYDRVTIGDIESLPAFTQSKKLDLASLSPAPVQDEDLARLASAWPELEEFSFRMGSCAIAKYNQAYPLKECRWFCIVLQITLS